MAIRQKNAEPFRYHGDKNKAVLLIHGFTGSPTEMEPLGKYLHKKGFSVYCPLLSGHGTTPEEMEETTWKDWVGTAEATLKSLKEKYKEVYMVGFSMGGCITLYLSMKYEIQGIVSISAPIYLVDKKAYFTPILQYIRRFKEKKRKPNFNVPIFSYDKTPIKSVSSLLRLITLVKSNLSKVKHPILIIQGDEDNVVIPKSADYIYKNVKSHIKEIKFYQKRSHMITVENGRDEVFNQIYDFLSKI
ncbi:alpha/beta fold hydrolase [Alkalicella caledoniensis]|uniref:Alpha/beta fold hydrolase n=1 Tax=Alkalicella caledoniensis TaxID=2731377 RepID=A0A7G9W6R9_ALKCA|nr:alpha/beta fold hydrolase [Alkalicella caledoniensis]QNO14381.1 alpha/beta fold hydrolase [Alkalicella caledoniensis]